MTRPSFVLGIAAVVLSLFTAQLPLASAQNAFSFSPGVAGKGKKCYFGECSDERGDNRGETLPSTQRTAPLPQAPTASPGGVGYGEELTDFGVQAQSFLQTQVGSPTPLTIPGARLVTTEQLRTAIQSGRREFLLVDALDAAGHQTIPGAYSIPLAGTAGNFNDFAQQQVFQKLLSLTSARVGYPIVFFCQGARCWESYNAALRAMRMGFSNVYWYRGGLSAWQQAGLPMCDCLNP
jgi:PQQ-dependent catabolism-associated CXXCW motif protein